MEDAYETGMARSAERFGINSLQDFQMETLRHVLAGGDAILSVHTGTSLCYQAFPEVWKALHPSDKCVVLVVAPRVAIMEEKVTYLRGLGYAATYIGEDPTKEHLIVQGEYTFVYCSPEAIIGKEKWRNMIRSQPYQNDLQLIAIEEGHKLTQRGKGRGQEWFQHVGELRSLLPRCPFIVLTSCASLTTRHKIKQMLSLRNPLVKVENPDCENIKLFVTRALANTPLDETFFWLIVMIREKRESCPRYIIFCKTIQDCASMYSTLLIHLPESMHGFFEMYHSMTDERVKEAIRKDMDCEDGKIRVLICTRSAMDIDYKGMREVIHFGPPLDSDTFLQQIGKAGRRKEPSHHLLIYNGKHIGNISSDMLQYCKNSAMCRRQVLLKPHGCQPFEARDLTQCCDICAATVDDAASVHPALQPIEDEEDDDGEDDDGDSSELQHADTMTEEKSLLLKYNIKGYMDSEAGYAFRLQHTSNGDNGMTFLKVLTFGHTCKSADELMERCDIWDFRQAGTLYKIIQDTLDRYGYDYDEDDIAEYLNDDD